MPNYKIDDINGGTHIAVTAPYSTDFRRAARGPGMDGKWDSGLRAWVFIAALRPVVQQYCNSYFPEPVGGSNPPRPRSTCHLGQVGQKLTVEVVIERVKDMDKRYANSNNVQYTQRFHVMREPTSGAAVIWTSSGGVKFDVGQRVVLTGTVKAHSEYNGELQTQMSRCKGVVRAVDQIPTTPTETQLPVVDAADTSVETASSEENSDEHKVVDQAVMDTAKPNLDELLAPIDF